MHSGTSASVLRGEWLMLGAATVILVLLASYRLDVYPPPWFDEGWYLQVPRNLVEHGEYATRSGDRFRHDDTVLSVMPTVYLPVAAAFELLGIGFLQARLIMVAYLLAAAGACYLLGRRLYGPLVAAVAVYLFLFRMEADPFTSTLILGRQVMGEVPAIAFVLFGCAVWRAAALAGRSGTAAAAGLLFGLAIVSKLQLVFVVPTALLAVGAIAWRQRARRDAVLSLVAVAVCGSTIGVWFLCVWSVLGTENATALAANVIAASAPQVRIGALAATTRSLSFLAGSTFLAIGLPAIVYALVLEAGAERPDPGRRLLLALIVASALWFTFRSIGWPRYAYPLLALSSLPIAKLLVDLGSGLTLVLQRSLGPARRALAKPIAIVLVGFVALALPLPNGRQIARGLLGPPDLSLKSLRSWLDRELPAGARIETWEFEVAVEPSAHLYSFPPVRHVDRMIASVFLESGDASMSYQPAGEPQYLVLGRFGKWTRLYVKGLEGAGPPLASFGEYDVYRLPPFDAIE
jgi:4-amino-4-deoxy-L-arabinose transferase-like glycosyltransferase